MRNWTTLLAGVLLACGGCGGDHDGEAKRAVVDGPNVLFVTLDTTRADRLGCYGYADATTPTLDALAASGIRCENAYCQVPLTLPSHTVMFTALNPPATGIHVNAVGALSETVPTLAERFDARGYRTGAFIAATVLDSRYGLDRGFDHYDDSFQNAEHRDVLHAIERPANEVSDAALAWLDDSPDEPFLAWVHYFDPHSPYAPPEGYEEYGNHPYDGEIAFMDAQLGRLITWLDERKLREKTLIVIAGDHGEAFGEHGEEGHGLLLYEPTVRVPVILNWPGRVPAGKVLDFGVGLVDLAPTVLELLEMDPLPDVHGESVAQLFGVEEATWRPIYVESEYPLVGFGWAPLRSLITENWKYIDAPAPELYARAGGPAEDENVVEADADVAKSLQEELDAFVASMQQREAVAVELSAEAMQELESLGYVGAGGAAASREEGGTLKNPMEMIDVATGLMAAKKLSLGGRHDEVVAKLEPLVARSPESDELYALLGHAYLQVGRYADAEQAFLKSLRTVPNDAKRLCHLGDALAAQNRVDEAKRCYESAIAANDAHVASLTRLGQYYFRLRQFSKAKAHMQRCLEVQPNVPRALSNLAYVHLQSGGAAKAVELFRRALDENPLHHASHLGLWQALNATRQRTEAIQALRRACEVLPTQMSLKQHLAGLLATTTQLGPAAQQEALRLAEQCVQASPQDPKGLNVLALACAATGDFARARDVARQALARAQQQGNAALAQQIATRLRAYQAGRMQ